jgi:hypothetical protein
MQDVNSLQHHITTKWGAQTAHSCSVYCEIYDNFHILVYIMLQALFNDANGKTDYNMNSTICDKNNDH